MAGKRRGFTLIESAIVAVIVVVLAAIAIPKFAKDKEAKRFKAACDAAGGIYYRAYRSTPLCLRRDQAIPLPNLGAGVTP